MSCDKMGGDILRIDVPADDAGQRLDRVLTSLAAQCGKDGLSRARLQALIKGGHVQLDGAVCQDPNHKLRAGQQILLDLPLPQAALPAPEALPLDIRYEDADLLVLNKAAGMVVHPAAGHHDGTLVNALLAHCAGSLSGIGGIARPGIVHRLDKETSGLMVVAKNDAAHQKLTSQFADRSLSRLYHAVLWGVPSPVKGEVEGAIGRHPTARQKMAVVAHGGRAALTHYQVMEAYDTLAALVGCKLATGRTHQIRVHMAHVRHPVVGDPLYGTRQKHPTAAYKGQGIVGILESFPRQALHAAEIAFIHPTTGQRIHLTAPRPPDMEALIRALRGLQK